MNFLDLAGKRQSDRGYSDSRVDRQVIERCLEAARLAPSACNSQPWFFVVVDEPRLRNAVAEKLHDMVMNKFVVSAPVLIAVVAELPGLIPRLAGQLKDKPYYLMDIGMAVENLCLQATQEGLGSCVLGWFDEKGVKQLLGVPKNKRVPLVITLGYASDPAIRTKIRKPAEQVWSYNCYPD